MQPSASRHVRLQDFASSLARPLRDADPHVIDALVSLALTVIAVAIVIGRPADDGDFRSDDALGLGLAVLQTLPLALRRFAPLPVLAVISAALVLHSALGYEVVQAGTISSLISVYGAAALTDTRGGIIAAVITGAAIAGFYATNRGDWTFVDAATTSATWGIAWVLGTFVRIRGEQAEAAGARVVSLELEQDARAREAVADERARMARELHDIVGHALNVIVIQASGAQRVFDARPEIPREALASIESTGREALSEMERMLGVLSAADAGDEALGPQPGLGQLAGLAAHVSEAGIPVDVVVEGDRPEIPASVELSAYRIVQESLTNCLKHSGASHAIVTVRYRPEELEVEVIDDGRGSLRQNGDMNRGGRGQAGMRERVALFGGEISMGPTSPADGYCVKARLPFRSTPA
jgi:signal transduction histidine kinase